MCKSPDVPLHDQLLCCLCVAWCFLFHAHLPCYCGMCNCELLFSAMQLLKLINMVCVLRHF